MRYCIHLGSFVKFRYKGNLEAAARTIPHGCNRCTGCCRNSLDNGSLLYTPKVPVQKYSKLKRHMNVYKCVRTGCPVKQNKHQKSMFPKVLLRLT